METQNWASAGTLLGRLNKIYPRLAIIPMTRITSEHPIEVIGYRVWSDKDNRKLLGRGDCMYEAINDAYKSHREGKGPEDRLN